MSKETEKLNMRLKLIESDIKEIRSELNWQKFIKLFKKENRNKIIER